MPKLSKAKRPKRRWIGLEVHGRLEDRTSIENAVAKALGDGPRLYDAVPASKRGGEVGVAVVRVVLDEAPRHRAFLSSPEAWEVHGLRSVTTSGKIRLVRERLALPRPPRR